MSIIPFPSAPSPIKVDQSRRGSPNLLKEPSIDGGGGGGGMEDRIARLEDHLTDVKVSLAKVETRMSHIDQTMLSKGQMAIYALLGAVTIIGGGWWIVQQYLAPILIHIPK
jgi:hypothetical protein